MNRKKLLKPLRNVRKRMSDTTVVMTTEQLHAFERSLTLADCYRILNTPLKKRRFDSSAHYLVRSPLSDRHKHDFPER